MSYNYFRTISFAVAIAVGGASLQGANFQGLGDLPGGSGSTLSTGDTTFESHAIGVSPNGNIVVGKSISGGAPSGDRNTEAMKWTAAGGMNGLGGDSTWHYYSLATGVSNNDVAVGYGDTTEFGYLDHMLRWTAPSGSSAPERFTLLGPLGPTMRQVGHSYTGNHPINGAGNLTVGSIAEIPFSNSVEAMVWVNNNTPLKLGWLAPGPINPPPQPGMPPAGYTDYSYANAINTPGTHIVGSSLSGSDADVANPKYTPPQAVMWHDLTAAWTTAPVAQGLGQVGGYGAGTASSASDLTNNGTKFVGGGCTTNDCFNDRLDRNGLLQPPETSTGFVGTWTGTYVAFLGTVGNTNLVSLGTLPVTQPMAVAASSATAIAGNGTTVVGWSTTTIPVQVNDANVNNPTHDSPIPIIGNEAFIWDPVLTSGQMVKLQDFLIGQGLGAQLGGWTLKEANDISDDGTVIVGTGINPSGNYEAFRAVIDITVPENGDYNDDGKVDAADYVKWRKSIRTPEGYQLWRTNFGMSFLGSGGSFSGEGSSVPEPGSALLVLAAVAIAGFQQRCRN